MLACQASLVLPAIAWAQGENPRCPNAPLRFPSGNWIWFAYTPGGHNGIDLVDKGRGTPIPNWPYYQFPENSIPVYAPLSGYLNVVGWAYGQPGSVLLTGTLDRIFEGKVPTRLIGLWLTHMSNYDGSVLYIVRPSGPINEGDLIGYQGRGNTAPVHLHMSVYERDTNQIQDPTTYVGALVNTLNGTPNNSMNFPVICNETPLGAIESPQYSGTVRGSTMISGYAIDPPNNERPGIDGIRLYRDGYWGSNGIFLGTATDRLPRPDIAEKYGAGYLYSGYRFNWNLVDLSNGRHGLYLYAHQTSSDAWVLMDVRYVNVQPPFSFLNFFPFMMR